MMNNAFYFLTKNNNVLQGDYPYTATDTEACNKNVKTLANSKLADYWSIKEESLDAVIDRL